MQVQKTTHFYKLSLDKNRVENCDLFSLPVFMKHCIRLLLNFVSKHGIFKRPESFRNKLNSTKRMARDSGVDHQLSAFYKKMVPLTARLSYDFI